MYSLKFAHLIKEKIPNVSCYEFYIDMRAFGKGYEEFADRIREEGTFVVRGHSASVEMVNGAHRQGRGYYESYLGRIQSRYGSSCGGVCSIRGTEELSRILGVSTGIITGGGFPSWIITAVPLILKEEELPAGMCQGPKDIPAQWHRHLRWLREF